MRGVLFAACLVVAALAVTIELSPEEMKGITANIKDAKAALKGMVEEETAEVTEMKHVKDDIESAGLTDVQHEAQLAEEEEREAARNEVKQQDFAIHALKEVRAVQPQFRDMGDKMKDASRKVDKVVDTLAAGTRTMNTRKLIQKMQKQSEKIALSKAALLGEARIPSKMPSSHPHVSSDSSEDNMNPTPAPDGTQDAPTAAPAITHPADTVPAPAPSLVRLDKDDEQPLKESNEMQKDKQELEQAAKQVEKKDDKKAEKKDDKKAEKKEGGTGVLSLMKSHQDKEKKVEDVKKAEEARAEFREELQEEEQVAYNEKDAINEVNSMIKDLS